MFQISGENKKLITHTPNLVFLRFILLFLLFSIFFLWPFSGLTEWHLFFLVFLTMALYVSLLRYYLVLIIYFSMMLLYWVVVPFIQQKTGVHYYLNTNKLPGFSMEALVFVIVHFLGIFFGLLFKVNRTHLNDPLALKFSFIGIFTSLAFVAVIILLTGYENIFSLRIDQDLGGRQGYNVFLSYVAKFMIVFIIIYFFLEGVKYLNKFTFICFLFFLFLLLFFISNPSNTPRFISLSGLLFIILAYLIKTSRLKLLALAVFSIPFYSVFLLGFTSSMRAGFNNINIYRSLDYIQSLEFSSYSIFLDALKVNDFERNNYLLSHLLIVVPRSLWDGKAESIGIFTAQSSSYVFNNIGLISFFNSYADYSFLGLFVFSIFFGYLAKKFNPLRDSVVFKNRNFIYGVILAGVSPILFRGDLSTAMITSYSAVTAYEIVNFATKIRIKKGSL